MEAHYGKQTFIIALFSILEHYVFQRKARKEFSQPHQYQLLWLQKKKKSCFIAAQCSILIFKVKNRHPELGLLVQKRIIRTSEFQYKKMTIRIKSKT